MTTTTTTTIGTVPFPRGNGGGGKAPLATAPLNDTINAINTPTTTTTTSKTGHHHNAERAVGTARIRNHRSSNGLAGMSSQAKKVQQQQQVYNRRSYGDAIRRQQQQVEASGNRSGSGFNTPDYTTGSHTGGRNGQAPKSTTFEFPSYESFHKSRGTSREVKPSGGAGGGVTHRHFVAQRAVTGRKDSSDEDDDDDDGEINRSRPAVYAARRPVMDRPRPRSAHFGDLEDHDNDDFPFQRRHEVDHRLRRQSTRQSIELGRLKMQEKDDEIKPAVSTISTFGATGNPMSAAGGAGRFTGEGVSVEGGLTRRQSEMASSRLRDDVIEAKVVLLGSQGTFRPVLPPMTFPSV